MENNVYIDDWCQGPSNEQLGHLTSVLGNMKVRDGEVTIARTS